MADSSVCSGGTSPQIGATKAAISQLDAIRVLAMLGVFLHHLWNTVIQTPENPLQRVLDVIFDTASDGVVLFNIISGFLLALPFLGPNPKPFPSYRAFLTKRCLRIIPPYYLALLLFSVANMVVFAVPLESALDTLIIHLLFMNSLDASMMQTNFSHFWYIGMLVQFYLLFPLFLSLFRRLCPWKAALLLTVVCWGAWEISAVCLPSHPDSSPGMVENLFHFNLPGRLPEFTFGMWAAAQWHRPAPSPAMKLFDVPFSLFCLSMVLILILGLPFVQTLQLPLSHIYHVALCVTGFVLLLLWEPIAQLGALGFMKDLSVQSYALYIVHEPFFSYLGVMPGKVPHTVMTFVQLSVGLLVLSYIGARALNWLCERAIPSLRTPQPALAPRLLPSRVSEDKKG